MSHLGVKDKKIVSLRINVALTITKIDLLCTKYKYNIHILQINHSAWAPSSLKNIFSQAPHTNRGY